MSELTDKELKNLKPRARLYKVTDRDGIYAAVWAFARPPLSTPLRIAPSLVLLPSRSTRSA